MSVKVKAVWICPRVKGNGIDCSIDAQTCLPSSQTMTIFFSKAKEINLDPRD